MNVHSIIIHNSQKVEATQMSINKWMSKQKMAIIQNEKVWSTYSCYNMGEPQKQYAKWKKSVIRASLVAQWYKIHLPKQVPWVWPLDWDDRFEKGMATHSSVFAWKIT